MPCCYNHVGLCLNNGDNEPTGGYTLAGTALGVTGDGVYMDGSERDQPELVVRRARHQGRRPVGVPG
jgi:hypothetical protein